MKTIDDAKNTRNTEIEANRYNMSAPKPSLENAFEMQFQLSEDGRGEGGFLTEEKNSELHSQKREFDRLKYDHMVRYTLF